MRSTINQVVWIAATCSILSSAAVSGGIRLDHIPIVDFDETDQAEWIVVNDGVMGGRSQSTIRQTGENTGRFTGQLSLENNGGFASVRALLKSRDFSSANGLEIRVRGDGREYQLRLRTDEGMDGVAYRAMFNTLDGVWATIQIPFGEFLPTFRGRILSEAESLDTADIAQVGLLLADKQPGDFSLEIDFVRAYIDPVPGS